MLSPPSRVLVLVAILATALLGAKVWHAQNRAGSMGGRISVPKLAWLLYTIFTWGLLTPIVALDPAVAWPFRLATGAFALSMWIRAAAEIPMLFVWMNWRPPIGIAHDLVTAGLVAGVLALTRREWWPPRDPAAAWIASYLVALLAGVLVEAFYAWQFERAVAGATTGRAGLWFASPDDPRFAFINRVTTAFDVVFYAALVAFLAAALHGPPPARA